MYETKNDEEAVTQMDSQCDPDTSRTAATVAPSADEAPATADEWRPSEALYGFAGWLTSRRERSIFSAVDDAAPAADAVAEFCKVNGLSDPREGWHRVLVHPEERADVVREFDSVQPLPWHAVKGVTLWAICDANDVPVCGGLTFAEATLIARAVNRESRATAAEGQVNG